jgi:hypothetical protein
MLCSIYFIQADVSFDIQVLEGLRASNGKGSKLTERVTASTSEAKASPANNSAAFFPRCEYIAFWFGSGSIRETVSVGKMISWQGNFLGDGWLFQFSYLPKTPDFSTETELNLLFGLVLQWLEDFSVDT